MTEKVKLPKDICDALEDAESRFTIATIIREIDIDNSKWVGSLLASQDFNIIIRALVLGYEAELPAEEQIRKLYTTPPTKGYENQKRVDHEKSYCGGIVDTLDALGIHYDWLEGDAE